MRESLEPHPIVHEFMDIIQHAPILPRPLRPLQALVLRAAVSLLPGWVAERLELRAAFRLRLWEQLLIAHLGALVDRIPLHGAPPAQACRRLGLPTSYLYRGGGTIAPIDAHAEFGS